MEHGNLHASTDDPALANPVASDHRWPVLQCLFLAASLLTLGDKITGTPILSVPALGLLCIGLVLSLRRISSATRVMWGLCAVATLAFIWTGQAFQDFVLAASRAMFVPVLLSVMTVLQTTLLSSPNVNRVAGFVVDQPPGRRFLMLAVAGHVFGILLNLGGYRLLLSLALQQCHAMTTDLRIRSIQERRILCAVLAGFGATILWSPVGVAINLMLPLIDEFDWIDYAPYGIAATLSFVGIAFLIDRAGPRPRIRPDVPHHPNVWRDVAQLVSLLLGISLGGVLIDVLFGIPMQGALLLIIPLAAMVWHLAGHRDRPIQGLKSLGSDAFKSLGQPTNEIFLILATGYLGLVLLKIVPQSAIVFVVDSLGWPPIAFAMVPMVLMTGFSMIGISPMITGILSVGALVEAGIGIPAPMLVLSALAGWAISMLLSPITATVAITASIMNLPPKIVGWRWNGALALLFALLVGLAFLVLNAFA